MVLVLKFLKLSVVMIFLSAFFVDGILIWVMSQLTACCWILHYSTVVIYYRRYVYSYLRVRTNNQQVRRLLHNNTYYYVYILLLTTTTTTRPTTTTTSFLLLLLLLLLLLTTYCYCRSHSMFLYVLFSPPQNSKMAPKFATTGNNASNNKQQTDYEYSYYCIKFICIFEIYTVLLQSKLSKVSSFCSSQSST